MLVAIVGSIGSGKDTLSDYLTTVHGFKRESFASSLKDVLSIIFGWDRSMLEGRTPQSRAWREEVDEWWANRLNIPHLTPRWVLQNFATEVCRESFHDDIWIASLEKKLLENTNDLVITDCRFPNEIAAIQNAGGKIIRINRGQEPEWASYVSDALKGDLTSINILTDNYKIHQSEWIWYNANFDLVIENNGTIDELYTKINDFINLELNHPVSK